MTNKKDLKREEIIRTAFSEWGKTGFRDTSLSSIALKMKVTKASLYRYFKNKEEIITSLADYFLRDYLKIGEKFIRENKNNSNLEYLVRNYVNDNFLFFAKTPEYLFFLCVEHDYGVDFKK
ncbi:MAG TPA: TetR/AcrR family transcriptional regulator [Spirochaetota bacterium]|nr:TetR/AcrR family transcriptional regulator [Spirochaetota bacterium]